MTAEKTYTREKKIRYHDNMIQNLIVCHNEEKIQAHAAFLKHRTLFGLDPEINPDRLPKTFANAMSRKDSALWATAFNKEYVGFQERKVFKVVRPQPGVKILGTPTRTEYKEDNGKFVKYKVRLVVRGDQQVAGESFNETDLYAQFLKSTEARLLLAIAAKYGCPVLKTDTQQAFLYGDMGDDVVYIRPPDWWPEPIPEGYCLQLVKSVYGTKQAARRWHLHISDWMERNEYHAVNSEKTIFMKRSGDDFIIHGLFVDDMMHVTTSDALLDEFMKKYTADFNVTGGGLMETFLGLEIIQTKHHIKLHLDHYVRDLLREYKTYIQMILRPKKVPISPGVILTSDSCPQIANLRKQKFYRSFLAKLQLAASWIRFDISFTVSQLARFCASVGAPQWAALHHLMEYLEGLPSMHITYRRRQQSGYLLSGFADSDWGNSESRSSTSGNMLMYNGALVMWRSKMQKTTALSTAEAEYYSGSTAATEVNFQLSVSNHIYTGNTLIAAKLWPQPLNETSVTLAQFRDRVTSCDTVTMTTQRELQEDQNKF
jgi:hypothetical protein